VFGLATSTVRWVKIGRWVKISHSQVTGIDLEKINKWLKLFIM